MSRISNTVIRKLSPNEIKDKQGVANNTSVYAFENKDTNLKGFIALHDESIKISVGGTRVFEYKNEDEALTDVLLLSDAMANKCKMAGLPYGGAKGVIISNPKKDKTADLLKSYAEVINSLEGKFYTGEDVGLTEEDVQLMLQTSNYFIGKSDQAGDPSEYASLSVAVVLFNALTKLFPNKEYKDTTIGIKGLGKVGKGLLKILKEKKFNIIGADIDSTACKEALLIYPDLTLVDSNAITTYDLDVYCPCALGNDINESNVSHIKAKLICGGANNQLSSHDISDTLFKNNILFVPDYLANAGGLINVADELEEGGYNKKRVLERIDSLSHVFEKLYLKSKQDEISLLKATENYLND